MSKIQNSDVKSESELIAAGATKSSLINDSKIYVSANSINKTLDDAITDGDIGSGGGGVGGINYIDNYDFEKDTNGVLPAGWATYSDAAGLAPVDGTGGTPNTTFLTTTTTPLRGINSSLVTKNSGASRQGEGVSYDFTIDSADQAQVLRISFDYNTSVNYADGDIRIYVYDVTNSRLIEVVDRDLSASSFGKFVGTFQTSPDSLSYRLIFHIADTDTTAWTVEIDNVIVGPQTIVKGAIVTEWEAFTPTLNVTPTNITPTGYYRRVGSDAEFVVRLDFTGLGPNASLAMVLPNGLNIDTTKIPTLTDQVTRLDSTGVFFDASGAGTANHFDVAAFSLVNTNGFRFWVNQTDDWRQFNPASVPVATAAGDVLFISVKIPIQGWSSNMVLSEDAGNREIYARLDLNNVNQGVSANGQTTILLSRAVEDTTNSFLLASNEWECPESGIYDINAAVYVTGVSAADNDSLNLRIDTFAVAQVFGQPGTNTLANSFMLSTSIRLVKGQKVGMSFSTPSISGDASYVINGSELRTYLTIAKRSSPQTIAASEIVAASYSSTNAESIPSTLSTTLVYETLLTGDTHNAYNTSTGEYTIPQTGWYNASASVRFNQDMLLPTAIISLAIKCGSTYVCTSSDGVKVAGVLRHGRLCSGSFYATKGQIVVVEVFQNSGASKTVEAAGTINIFSIIKINGAS